MKGHKNGSLLSRARILVVDDDVALTKTIAQILESLGCSTYTLISSAAEAVNFATQNTVDIILMDIVFQKEKIDGSDAMLIIQEKITVPVVYISGYSDTVTIEKIKTTKSAWFLQKPFDRDELRITLELALYNHLEDSLHRSEKRYQRITQTISDYIYTVKIKDHQAVETIHGSACRAVTGYSPGEFIENPLLWLTIIPETERGMVKEHFEKMIQTADPTPIEHRIVKKDGRIRWIRNTPVFYFNSNGELEAYDGIISDVTERKIAEEALLAQREALEDLVVQRTENLIKVNEQLTRAEADLRLKNERMLWDLKQAKLSQEIILPPHMLSTGFLSIDYIYQPMDLVGGDFLSFNQFKDDEAFSVFLGDVAGHGISAALYTHSLKAIADRLPRNLLYTPDRYIEELNNSFFHFVNGSPNALFATGIYGFFSKNSSGEIVFTFSNAGCQYPLIFRAGEKTVEEAVLSGTIMGHFENMNYDEKAVPLYSRDRLFLYTDGINETTNEKKQQLETEGLKEILLMANLKGLPVPDTLNEVIAMLNDFRGKMPVQDDIVIIGAEIH